ncbi:MAG: YeeE/YedE family protein [Bacteroidetes bacterium]|nr:YeeE/YedE family protein [Bacteroidota bacterium]
MLEFIKQPWPWYVAGPLIGLTVPTLLIIGNKAFGLSSSLRHICASCVPADIPLFNYDWKKESWNLFFVAGITIGGFLAATFLDNPNPVEVAPATATLLNSYGITDFNDLLPAQVFNWENLFTMRGLIFFVIGGFMIGFGTRYANGCTSGHSITGLSNLQWPSLVATIAFMVGGFISANFFVPLIFKLF